MTGKQTVEEDGENYTYYFDKKTGAARTAEVVDGVIYGEDGRRIEAQNGNTYDIVELRYDVTLKKATGTTPATIIPEGSSIIVSSTGKLRTSTSGHVKVDGVQYKVKRQDGDNGKTAGTWKWEVEEKVEDN